MKPKKSEKIDKLQRIQAETTECLICLPIDLLWSATSHLLLVLPLLLLTRWEINVTLQRTERCSSASVLEVFFSPNVIADVQCFGDEAHEAELRRRRWGDGGRQMIGCGNPWRNSPKEKKKDIGIILSFFLSPINHFLHKDMIRMQCCNAAKTSRLRSCHPLLTCPQSNSVLRNHPSSVKALIKARTARFA